MWPESSRINGKIEDYFTLSEPSKTQQGTLLNYKQRELFFEESLLSLAWNITTSSWHWRSKGWQAACCSNRITWLSRVQFPMLKSDHNCNKSLHSFVWSLKILYLQLFNVFFYNKCVPWVSQSTTSISNGTMTVLLPVQILSSLSLSNNLLAQLSRWRTYTAHNGLTVYKDNSPVGE